MFAICLRSNFCNRCNVAVTRWEIHCVVLYAAQWASLLLIKHKYARIIIITRTYRARVKCEWGKKKRVRWQRWRVSSSVLISSNYRVSENGNITCDIIRDVLDTHNRIRQSIAEGSINSQPPAANMRELVRLDKVQSALFTLLDTRYPWCSLLRGTIFDASNNFHNSKL